MPEFENIFYQKKTGYKEDKNLTITEIWDLIARVNHQGALWVLQGICNQNGSQQKTIKNSAGES